MKHFYIKVCGITRVKDALLAAELGVDMVGMIFYGRSPRWVSFKQAKKIVERLPPTIDRVGVFVNENIDKVLKAAADLKLDYVQLHGNETSKDVVLIKRHGYRVIKAYKLSSKADYAKLYSSKANLVLVDNVTAEKRGGTGQRFDWSLTPPKKIKNLMLAGGISVDNIEEGVRIFHPLVIDVNSGVEAKPGTKSEVKLKRFFDKCNLLRYGKR